MMNCCRVVISYLGHTCSRRRRHQRKKPSTCASYSQSISNPAWHMCARVTCNHCSHDVTLRWYNMSPARGHISKERMIDLQLKKTLSWWWWWDEYGGGGGAERTLYDPYNPYAIPLMLYTPHYTLHLMGGGGGAQPARGGGGCSVMVTPIFSSFSPVIN